MKIFFVRHGKDDDGYRGGWSDFDLIPEGKEQAERLARHLKENNGEYRIRRIISSDLQRALSTARFIAEELDLPVREESRLREINNGDLAGMPNDEALEKYPGLFFSSLQMDEPYPNGESPAGFYTRIKNWFDEFTARCNNTNDNILVVTHGGVINIIYYLVNGMEWSNKNSAFKTENCGVYILNTDTMNFEVGQVMNKRSDIV